MNDWRFAPLRRVARLKYGESLAALSNQKEGEHPIYGSNGLLGWGDRTNAEGPCLIVGRKGSAGRLTYVPTSSYASDTAFYIDSSSTNENIRWLAYVLSPLKLETRAEDSAVPGLSRDLVEGSTIPIPSQEQQRAIVRFLDEVTTRIDTLIKKKLRLLAILSEQQKDRAAIGLIRGLDDSEPVDSGVEWLGEIAEGWTVRRAGALFRERDARGEPNLPLLEVSLNRGVTIREFSDDRIERVAADFAQQKIARRNDLVFNKMRMWQGAVGVAPEDGLVSTDYTVAEPIANVDSHYFARVLRTPRSKVEIDKWSHGMVRDRNRLYWDGFKNIQLPVPPHDEQQEILRWLRDAAAGSLAVESRITRAIERLQEYQAALITAAVTGQIDIPGAA